MKINKCCFVIGMFLAFGFFSALLFGCGQVSTPTSTTLGVVWNLSTEHANFPVCGKHTSLVFNNKMWIIGGWPSIEGFFPSPRQDVWFSTDGIAWTQATAEAAFNKRCSHASIVFNNKMWVIGGSTMTGNTNDVWCSTDGITWTQATAEAPFSARSGLSSIVFDGKMWVIAGEDDSACKNDVWSSTNGTTWTQTTASAEFSARAKFAATIFDSKIWLTGGMNAADPSSSGDNDVWFSANGLDWTLATAEAAFGHRSNHTCINYNNKIWVIGGGTDLYSPGGAASYINDVWWSN